MLSGNWSARLFFFVMVTYLIYVILIGDAPKWYQLLTQKSASVTTTPAGPAGPNTTATATGLNFIGNIISNLP